MKIAATLILSLPSALSFCQQGTTMVFDEHGNIIAGSFIKTVPPHVVTLKDPALNYTFILDSTHVYVTAYDSTGNIVWKTDPYTDNKIWEYRTKRPIIVDFLFGKSGHLFVQGREVDPKKTHKVIWIKYNNTQFGSLDLKTGKYIFEGQD